MTNNITPTAADRELARKILCLILDRDPSHAFSYPDTEDHAAHLIAAHRGEVSGDAKEAADSITNMHEHFLATPSSEYDYGQLQSNIATLIQLLLDAAVRQRDEEITRLREALAFYATYKTWRSARGLSGEVTPATDDGGKRAREAVKESESWVR